jgi:hypothetical protein
MKSETPQALLQAYLAAFNRAALDALVASYERRGALVAQPGMIAEGAVALREALAAPGHEARPAHREDAAREGR